MIAPHLNSHFGVTLKFSPLSSFKPCLEMTMTQAEAVDLIFLWLRSPLQCPCVYLNADVERRSDSASLPASLILYTRPFCVPAKQANPATCCTTLSHTWQGSPHSTHMTSPICHSLIPCPPVEKHCSYK